MTVIATRVTDESVWLVAKAFKGGTKYFGFSDTDRPVWMTNPTVAHHHHSADYASGRRVCAYYRFSFKNSFVAKLDIKTTFNVSVDCADLSETSERRSMNDRKFAEVVSKASLFEVLGMTSVKDTWYPPTGHPQTLGYEAHYMMVYRKRREANQDDRRALCEWFPTDVCSTRKRRLWCMLDMSNGCAGESEGRLWMFAFRRRADARDYCKRLDKARAAGANVVNVSHIFCMWA